MSRRDLYTDASLGSYTLPILAWKFAQEGGCLTIRLPSVVSATIVCTPYHFYARWYSSSSVDSSDEALPSSRLYACCAPYVHGDGNHDADRDANPDALSLCLSLRQLYVTTF